MFPELCHPEPPKRRTSGSSSKNSSALAAIPFQSLDLTPGAGNLLDEFYWEILSPWRGESSILNTGPAPRSGAAGSTLSSILEANPHPKYFLTRKACAGIIRRSSERGKPLPPALQKALELQAGLRQGEIPKQDDAADEVVGFDGYNGDLTGGVTATLGTNCGMSTGRNGIMNPIAFAANQRDEVRDLHDVAGALSAQPGMKQQTFIASGVVSKGNGDCFLTDEVHTTLSAGGGQAGRGYPCVLCLNDQGGQFMSCSVDITGTLRSQMNQHQPLILESNRDQSSAESPDVYCIVGNAIDRQPQNGGNGFGYQEDISYTLTAMDRHAIFSRQRTDVFRENDVVSTESARQHKDATDLVMQPYQETVGSLVRSDHKGISNQYVSDDKCIVSNINLIRRLTPLECERLQGFPDGWTNIPSASDSARYKALGNSVAIPCVEFVMKGVATFLKYENEKRRRRRGWRIQTCSLIVA